ncbi:MAG: sporulation transcriptional regulator SpoIIID [Clostridia bacterium]|nr:sporulation transcriptional regulator SpoIIID [Clostridia bacterium]
MLDPLLKRVKDEAVYIAETGSTVRKTAEVFGVSKSTVHKDITERLPAFDEELSAKVRAVLDKNLSERHIRGGIATREMYRKRKV